jgi:hypothetical protein
MPESVAPNPADYRPSSYCPSCGRDFTADYYFDQHRVGDHELDYPAHLNGRRCATVEEMRAKGLRQMTDEEMRASPRHRHRAGFGVELWFDPARAAGARARLGGLERTP